jgi:hypothetical protein
MKSPLGKVIIDGTSDPARIVYGAHVGLQTLSPGRYLLQVDVFDRIAKTSASREVSFEVE